MTDGSGAVQAQYSFDPFGRVTKLQGGLDSDFQYAGYLIHQRSGLSLTLFRAYNAQTGRWISRDPIDEAGGVNLYAYVHNEPVGRRDPLGLMGAASGATSAYDAGESGGASLGKLICECRQQCETMRRIATTMNYFMKANLALCMEGCIRDKTEKMQDLSPGDPWPI